MTSKQRRDIVRSTVEAISGGRQRWELDEHIYSAARNMGLTISKADMQSIAAEAVGWRA